MCECRGTFLGKAGGKIGDRIQNTVVKQAGKRIKAWTGLGDYDIKFNSLVTGNPDPTKFSTTSRGLIIRHKEYLGDVITSPAGVGAFNFVKFQINPGNVVAFPWLAPIATQFDQYRPLGIIFEFVSTASETSTSATLGSVLMSAQYDINDADPASKSEMMNRDYSSESKMSEGMVHGLECDPSETQRQLFYCSPYFTTNADPREYYMCNVYVGTQGGSLPVNTTVGSLYVHYEFELFKQLPFGGLNNRGMLWQQNYAEAALVSTVLNFTSLPPVFTRGRDLGITFNGLTISFPIYLQGYVVKVKAYCANNSNVMSFVAPGSNPPTYTNCTYMSFASNTQNSAVAAYAQTAIPNLATSQYLGAWEACVKINANINSPATISWTTSCWNFPVTTAATGTTSWLFDFEVVPATYNSKQ